eukprot:GABU01002036.1.p2 GENE.GABU01002036.1~~GABU01002036.1.p2  ORF type:complete len:101 (-),score=8.07 GABU01002036.1:78-356(-)
MKGGADKRLQPITLLPKIRELQLGGQPTGDKRDLAHMMNDQELQLRNEREKKLEQQKDVNFTKKISREGVCLQLLKRGRIRRSLRRFLLHYP